MAPYRKKPVVIEAMQWTGDNLGQIVRWVGDQVRVHPSMNPGVHELDIVTLEDGHDGRAKHVASLGDWIIRGVQGELYACKPDIFAATYEPVEDAA